MIMEINMPDIGSDVVEVTEILVKNGDKIEIDQPLITVEGDKVSIEIPSAFTGTVKELKVNIGDKVSTGSLIMIIESENKVPVEDLNVKEINTITLKDQSESVATSITGSLDRSKFQKDNTYVHATPSIRRLAREFNIDLKKVKGTGRKNRILREDIQMYIRNLSKFNETNLLSFYNKSLSNLSCPKIDFSKFGEVEEIELSRIQKTSGAHLSHSWFTIPHVTHFDKVDITDLEVFRKKQNAEYIEHKLDFKITLIAFIMKAVATALERMPRFNSSLNENDQVLVLKKYINIGVAVDTVKGLLVPVFKKVNRKGILELSQELTTTVKKARIGKLTTEEMQGGCFTISSIGNLGTTHFTPIINAPEVAILGISKFSMEPLWLNKEFVPRLILPISLSFDHRVIDGADGAKFITLINNILSDIRSLLM